MTALAMAPARRRAPRRVITESDESYLRELALKRLEAQHAYTRASIENYKASAAFCALVDADGEEYGRALAASNAAEAARRSAEEAEHRIDREIAQAAVRRFLPSWWWDLLPDDISDEDRATILARREKLEAEIDASIAARKARKASV